MEIISYVQDNSRRRLRSFALPSLPKKITSPVFSPELKSFSAKRVQNQLSVKYILFSHSFIPNRDRLQERINVDKMPYDAWERNGWLTVTDTEIVVVNSRFIASAAPVFSNEEARDFINSVKAKYPDATHHVPAYVLGYGNSVSAYCSDDGEPSGSAGRPVLAVLQGSGLGDAAIVVTRYFGGTKLGIGGLVHAYGDAAKEVLAILPRAEKVPTYTVMMAIEYSYFERVRLLLQKWKALTMDEDFGADVTITARFIEEALPKFQAELSELTRGQVQAEVIEFEPETIMPLGAFVKGAAFS